VPPDEVDAAGLDMHLARLLTRLDGREHPLHALSVRLICRLTSQGHICANLAELAEKPLGEAAEHGRTIAPAFADWCEALRRSPAVGRPGDYAPLILDEAGRLYLYRYWAYERHLAEDLRRRVDDEPSGLDLPRLRQGLDRLFPPMEDVRTDWQRIAAATALLKCFCVISGGPGTGKTTTVIRILALLVEQAAGQRLHVALTAPTGKAAARMQEAIRQARDHLPVISAIREAIPGEATTIHRLLGVRSGSVRFRHDRDNPLPVDLVVVDEASMVDLALMAKLVQALPAKARLILLGDKDQLASVEAGAVLGDICGDSPGFSAAFRERLIQVAGQDPGGLAGPTSPQTARPDGGPAIRDAIVELQRSYRFGEQSGIGRLARHVNRGEGREALALLERGDCEDVIWRPLESERHIASRLADVADRLGACFAVNRPDGALMSLDRYRLLSAHRAGPFGVETLNQRIEERLEARGLIRSRSPWYHGRPVLITANDYGLRLFNGDLGITLSDPASEGRLRVFFRTVEGGIRRLPPARLPEHETAYATTIHKSQGSEAESVLLVLPDELSPVMTRELIYTGITRARSRVEIWGTASVFEAAVSCRLQRSSGLRDALWGAP
jgi:exodeoxyribonuclease V alpha subunit